MDGKVFPEQSVNMVITFPLPGGYEGQRPGAPSELIDLAQQAVIEGNTLWDMFVSTGRTDFEQMGVELGVQARIAKEYVNGAYVMSPEFVKSIAPYVNDILTEIARLESGSDVYFDGAMEQWNFTNATIQLENYWWSSEMVWDYLFSLEETITTIPEKVAAKAGKVIKIGIDETGLDPTVFPYAWGVGAGVAVGVTALGVGLYFLAKR